MKLRYALALAMLLGAPLRASAQRAWIDPETGKLGVPPAEEAAQPAGEAGGAAEAPLVVEPGKTKAGGVMVDLSGRPLYELKATLLPSGKVVEDCVERDIPR